MAFRQPVTALMEQRFSCRNYTEQLIEAPTREGLSEFMASLPAGPFGSRPRFALLAATADDRDALRGLGTYGFIKGSTGFIAGASRPGERHLEDFGYLMELIILHATDLGLGTCWLGGTFTKSRFARKMGLRRGEEMPAITATGHCATRRTVQDTVSRAVVGSDRRLPWDHLFFDGNWDSPLPAAAAREWATPLKMVRIGPSASNKQPWRIVRDGQRWHFYMERSALYRPFPLSLAGISDMPRLDMGIAMCHFELAARELGLPGAWASEPPHAKGSGGPILNAQAEYVVTWTSRLPATEKGAGPVED